MKQDLRKSLYRMKFTDRFKGDGKKLYDKLVKLSNNNDELIERCIMTLWGYLCYLGWMMKIEKEYSLN